MFAYLKFIDRLVEWIGSGAPVREEHAETDSLEQTGQNTYGDGIERSLLGDDTGDDLGNVNIKFGTISGRTYTWSGRGEEDQGPKVGSTLVAESTSGIDKCGNTVGLNTGSDERRAPAGGSGGGFTRLEELFAAVRGFGALVGVTEERSEHGQRGGLVEDDAKGDCRRLDRWEVWS